MTVLATPSIFVTTIITLTVIVISLSFRIMDTHTNELSKLCHISYKAVITGKGYCNASTVYDYQITLATYLKIDVNENEDVSHLKIPV